MQMPKPGGDPVTDWYEDPARVAAFLREPHADVIQTLIEDGSILPSIAGLLDKLPPASSVSQQGTEKRPEAIVVQALSGYDVVLGGHLIEAGTNSMSATELAQRINIALASVPSQQEGDGHHDSSDCEHAIAAMLAVERAPSLTDGSWQDGHELECPTCGARFVHVCDESDGCSWEAVRDA